MANRLDFGRQNGKQVENANRKEVRAGDVEEVSVSDSDWTEVYVDSSTNTKRYAPGYGYGNRQASEAGYADLDLRNSSANPIDGNFRWVLYESSDHDVPLRISSDMSSTALRNSVTADLTDKQLHPGRTPAGKQDRELVLEFKAASGSDGDTISQADSTADSGIPYSMFRK